MVEYYSTHSVIEIAIMTFALQVSSVFGIPVVRYCFSHKNLTFEGCLILMNLVASSLFHYCQIYTVEVFLSQLQWQRIDNILTITSFQLVVLHLCGAIYGQGLIIKLFALFSTIIIQEKDPWNFTYTIVPIVTSLLIGIAIRLYKRKRRIVIYDYQKLIVATSLMLVASYFFVAGLQKEQDYLRLNHAVWHIFAASSAYFCLSSVIVSESKSNEYIEIEKLVDL